MYLCVVVVQFFSCLSSARLLYQLVSHLYYMPIATDIRKTSTQADEKQPRELERIQKRILNYRPHNRGNRYMQRIVLPQSVCSLPTSVAASVDYYTNYFECNPSRWLKQSVVILIFDSMQNCLFDDPSKFAT